MLHEVESQAHTQAHTQAHIQAHTQAHTQPIPSLIPSLLPRLQPHIQAHTQPSLVPKSHPQKAGRRGSGVLNDFSCLKAFKKLMNLLISLDVSKILICFTSCQVQRTTWIRSGGSHSLIRSPCTSSHSSYLFHSTLHCITSRSDPFLSLGSIW